MSDPFGHLPDRGIDAFGLRQRSSSVTRRDELAAISKVLPEVCVAIDRVELPLVPIAKVCGVYVEWILGSGAFAHRRASRTLLGVPEPTPSLGRELLTGRAFEWNRGCEARIWRAGGLGAIRFRHRDFREPAKFWDTRVVIRAAPDGTLVDQAVFYGNRARPPAEIDPDQVLRFLQHQFGVDQSGVDGFERVGAADIQRLVLGEVFSSGRLYVVLAPSEENDWPIEPRVLCHQLRGFARIVQLDDAEALAAWNTATKGLVGDAVPALRTIGWYRGVELSGLQATVPPPSSLPKGEPPECAEKISQLILDGYATQLREWVANFDATKERALRKAAHDVEAGVEKKLASAVSRAELAEQTAQAWQADAGRAQASRDEFDKARERIRWLENALRQSGNAHDRRKNGGTLTDRVRELLSGLGQNDPAESILRAQALLANGRVQLHPKAIESVEKQGGTLRPLARLEKLLETLRGDYYKAILAGKSDEFAASNIFSPGQFAPTEGDHTLNNFECMKARTFTWQGEKVVAVRHLRLGEHGRIYFAWIRPQKGDPYILICHAGEHLLSPPH